jgi:membrane associated rhomboid family serine protease
MEAAVRAAESARQANEWALVLAAMRVPHRIELSDGAWVLLVPEAQLGRAQRALRAYDVENRRAVDRPAPPGASARTAWTVGLLLGVSLLAVFAATGPPSSRSPWFGRGAAAAGPMLHGEPWRALTALTLHLDTAHALGNAVATALLVPPIVERLGPGSGLALVLLAGAAANLLGAAMQEPQHVAAGASTATFGALGILAGMRLNGPSASSGTWKRWWTTLGAATLLLAILGTGRGTDVLGHTLGVATGGALGLAAGFARRPIAPPLQWALIALAAVAVVGSWWLALGG